MLEAFNDGGSATPAAVSSRRLSPSSEAGTTLDRRGFGDGKRAPSTTKATAADSLASSGTTKMSRSSS
ncbi:hypothetical protein ACLOJK_033701 [Asimina triloba]